MMLRLGELDLPTVQGGRVTDCIFTTEGWISEMWIALDADSTGIKFLSAFKVTHDAKVHLTTKATEVGK